MAGFIVQSHTEAMAFQSLLNCTFGQQYCIEVYSKCLGGGPHLVQFTENLNLCAVNSVGGCSAVATVRHTVLQYAAWRAALPAIVEGRRRCIITGYFSPPREWAGVMESYCELSDNPALSWLASDSTGARREKAGLRHRFGIHQSEVH